MRKLPIKILTVTAMFAGNLLAGGEEVQQVEAPPQNGTTEEPAQQHEQHTLPELPSKFLAFFLQQQQGVLETQKGIISSLRLGSRREFGINIDAGNEEYFMLLYHVPVDASIQGAGHNKEEVQALTSAACQKYWAGPRDPQDPDQTARCVDERTRAGIIPGGPDDERLRTSLIAFDSQVNWDEFEHAARQHIQSPENAQLCIENVRIQSDTIAQQRIPEMLLQGLVP